MNKAFENSDFPWVMVIALLVFAIVMIITIAVAVKGSKEFRQIKASRELGSSEEENKKLFKSTEFTSSSRVSIRIGKKPPKVSKNARIR